MIIDKASYEVGDSLSKHRSIRNQESEIVVKFDELRNSILNFLVERRNVVFYAQCFQ